jgi:hypothetical protein
MRALTGVRVAMTEDHAKPATSENRLKRVQNWVKTTTGIVVTVTTALATIITALTTIISAVTSDSSAKGSGTPNSYYRTRHSPATTESVGGKPSGFTSKFLTSKPGNLLTQFSAQIYAGSEVMFTDTPSRPAEGDSGDLYFDIDFGPFINTDGQLSLLGSGDPSYQGCESDTDFMTVGPTEYFPLPDTTLCFTGHNIVASVTMVGEQTSSNNPSITIDVTVWKGP